MKSNHTTYLTPQFRILSDSQLEELHLAALEVLRRTGVELLDEEARDLLRKAGAWLDGTRVRIPAHLVEWAIRTAPSSIVLCNSGDGRPALFLEDGRAYYGTGSDTRYIIDPYSGERRSAVKADIANVARVCDYLPNIDFVMCMGIAQDVPAALADLHHFEAMVTNTTKPLVVTAWNLGNLKTLVQMAEAVAGGQEPLARNPFFALYTEPISPLQLAREPTQKLLYMARRGLPCIWTPGQVGGATSPVTLAGSLALGNAEALAGLLLAQLAREGAPVIYGGVTLHMDMATTVAAYASSPEFVLSVAAFAELARYYKVPAWSYAACADSKCFDQQAAYESALSILVAALTGGNLIHDVGYLESGLTASLESVVAADEFIGLTKRMMQGIEITPETLALDVIDQVGPGGHFLSEQHTLSHFRADWRPRLFDRGVYEDWSQKGQKTLGQKANDKVRHILETHVARSLPKEVQDRLTQIIATIHGQAGSLGL